MTHIPADTTAEQAAWEQMQFFRQMSCEERLILSCRMTDERRARTAAEVRQRHPEYSEEQVKFAAIRLYLGDELFDKAYPRVELPHCDCCESLRWTKS